MDDNVGDGEVEVEGGAAEGSSCEEEEEVESKLTVSELTDSCFSDPNPSSSCSK